MTVFRMFHDAVSIVLVVFLIGINPSSCVDQQIKGHIVPQEDSCAAVAINQLAILEVIDVMRKEVPTPFNFCAGTSASLDQLQSQVEQLESSISEREKGTSASLDQLQSQVEQLESSISEREKGTSASLDQLQSQVERLESYIDETANQILTPYDELQSQIEEMKSNINEEHTGILEQLRTLRVDFQNRTADLETQLQNYKTKAKCVEPFFMLGSECFFINDSERKTWHEARRACKNMNADLAEPDDFRTFLEAKKQRIGDSFVWLGLSDALHENLWEGVSETIVDMTSAPWYSGEPNNEDGNEHYVVIWEDNLLNDSPATEKYYFACEYQLL